MPEEEELTGGEMATATTGMKEETQYKHKREPTSSSAVASACSCPPPFLLAGPSVRWCVGGVSNPSTEELLGFICFGIDNSSYGSRHCYLDPLGQSTGEEEEGGSLRGLGVTLVVWW